MREILESRLDLINDNIEIYKKNTIKAVEKEEMIPATGYLLVMRDLKEQQLLIKSLLKED